MMRRRYPEELCLTSRSVPERVHDELRQWLMAEMYWTGQLLWTYDRVARMDTALHARPTVADFQRIGCEWLGIGYREACDAYDERHAAQCHAKRKRRM